MSLLSSIRYLFKSFEWEEHWNNVLDRSKKFTDAEEQVLDMLMRSAEKRLDAVMQLKREIGRKNLQLLIFLATGEAGLIGYIVSEAYSSGRNALLALAFGLMTIISLLIVCVIPSFFSQPYLMMKEWSGDIDVLAFKRYQLASLYEMSKEIERESTKEILFFSGALAASCLLALVVLIVNVHAS